MKFKKTSLLWLIIVLLISFGVTKFQDRFDPRVQSIQLAPEEMAVVYLDTGNSDAILIHFPNQKTMLIDTGKPDDFDTIDRAMKRFQKDTIDYAVISHQHDDHIGSFPEVLKKYRIGTVYMPVSPISNPQTKESMALIEEKNIPLVEAKAGVVICDGEVKAEFLSPLYSHYGDANDYSGVVYLTYGNKSFLFMGDATTNVENDLLSKNAVPHADVLKVGHHGSKGATSKNFLNAVTPEYAIITTGENDYGHPTKKVLDLLSAKGIKTYRSDFHGTIAIITDGKTLTVTHE